MRACVTAAAVLAACASATCSIPALQQQALVDLYNSAGGKAWKHTTNWLTSASACTWYGVACDSTGSYVTGLKLQSNRLAGTVPDSIGNLANLT